MNKRYLFKKVVKELDVLKLKEEILVEQLQTYLEMAIEDIHCFMRDNNKDWRDNLVVYFIEQMFSLHIKSSYCRMKTMYGDTPNFDYYSDLLVIVRGEKEAMRELMLKS